MNFPLDLGSAALAETQRELNADRVEVSAIADRVNVMVGFVPRVTAGDWSGPASVAFGAACDQVAHDIASALVALRTSSDLLDLAAGELAQHG